MSEQILNQVDNPFPEGNQAPPKTGREHWTYYKEAYAKGAAKLLDNLFTNARTMRIKPRGTGLLSLRLQYYQGIYYLLDKLDPKGEYLKKYKQTICRTNQREGYLELSIKKDINDVEITEDSAPTWREQFLEFLETSTPGQKFPVNFTLSKDDQDWLRGQLAPFDADYIYQISDRETIIIRDSK